jgi:hypothetical protein
VVMRWLQRPPVPTTLLLKESVRIQSRWRHVSGHTNVHVVVHSNSDRYSRCVCDVLEQ